MARTLRQTAESAVDHDPERALIVRSGVDIRRRDLPDDDVEVLLGMRVTSIPLTVLETGDSILMDRALQTRVSLEVLEAVHTRNLPRAGAARSRELLRVAADGGRSAAERLLHRIIDPLPGWRAQVSVGPFAVDAAFEESRVAIEVDGWRWHKDARRNSDDLRRQNYLVNRGWRVLRYDWHRLDGEPAEVLAEVVEAPSHRPVRSAHTK